MLGSIKFKGSAHFRKIGKVKESQAHSVSRFWRAEAILARITSGVKEFKDKRNYLIYQAEIAFLAWLANAQPPVKAAA